MIIVGIMMTIEEIIIKEIMITVKNIKNTIKGMVKEKDMIEINNNSLKERNQFWSLFCY
jgi:regulator of replication initiation timing